MDLKRNTKLTKARHNILIQRFQYSQRKTIVSVNTQINILFFSIVSNTLKYNKENSGGNVKHFKIVARGTKVYFSDSLKWHQDNGVF